MAQHLYRKTLFVLAANCCRAIFHPRMNAGVAPMRVGGGRGRKGGPALDIFFSLGLFVKVRCFSRGRYKSSLSKLQHECAQWDAIDHNVRVCVCNGIKIVLALCRPPFRYVADECCRGL